MKHMKKPFAMLLCVAMVLSLCMTFAGAEDAVYGPYATLDDIPEDCNIFRSIRTGEYSYVESGDYYEFHEAGYPIVRIKRGAFLTKPNNGYLTEDSQKLAQNCKNQATKDENNEFWSAKRVCYYKAWESISRPRYIYWKDGSAHYIGTFDSFTASIYRLELNVCADYSDKVGVGVRLTSGVTFDYDAIEPFPKYALKRRDNKIPIRPSVSVDVTDNAQNVWPTECEITNTSTSGKYAKIFATEAAHIAADILACRVAVATAVFETGGSMGGAAPLAVAETAIACTQSALDAIPRVVDLATYSPEKGYPSPAPVRYDGAVPSSIVMENSGDFVNMMIYLNDGNYVKSQTNFRFSFAFTCT